MSENTVHGENTLSGTMKGKNGHKTRRSVVVVNDMRRGFLRLTVLPASSKRTELPTRKRTATCRSPCLVFITYLVFSRHGQGYESSNLESS